MPQRAINGLSNRKVIQCFEIENWDSEVRWVKGDRPMSSF